MLERGGTDGEEPVRRRMEILALVSVIGGALALFPVAVAAGILSTLRLPRGNAYRRVGAAGAVLGILETLVFLVVALVVLFYDPFPARQRAAVDQLRKIVSAQGTFKENALVDQDGDGVGEFGLLAELALGRSLADSGPEATGAVGSLISRVFARPTAEGYVEKYGYYFLVYLPGRNWSEGIDGRGGRREWNRAFADAQEATWIAYAWPAVSGRTAEGVFVASPTGIYRSTNREARFDGVVNRPKPTSALTGVHLGSGVPPPGKPSLCGDRWVPVE